MLYAVTYSRVMTAIGTIAFVALSGCDTGIGLEAIGCATRVRPPERGFQLVVPCGFDPDNSFLTPIGNEIYLQAFVNYSPVSNILVAVVPPGSGGSALDEEFNSFESTGTFTSSFGIVMETAENVTATGYRQFFAAIELLDGNVLIIGATGLISDAAQTANSAQLMYRSVQVFSP